MLNSDTPTGTILEEDERNYNELKVTFYPPLFLQRRMWILDVLRAENISEVLDIGCGEGQLLSVLCQPAPWLAAPPPEVLPLLESCSSGPVPASPIYNEEIASLHPTKIIGLDISTEDLAFAIQGTTPPQQEVNLDEGSNEYCSRLTNIGLRWDELEVNIWEGGLEVVNENFIDIECIVSTEVIEHLPPNIFPAYATVLLGIYHPKILLITTPSYTFNARFTAPTAPTSAHRGYPDPTGRTDRVFRHSDHKFEWTAEEFRTWCHEVSEEWGYEVHVASVGHAVEMDEWGRDDELGGATSVAIFRRLGKAGREQNAREMLIALGLHGDSHKRLSKHIHVAHPNSKMPGSFKAIGDEVKVKMEEFREAFMRVEELWFEREIAVLCGGWIEVLIRAVEVSDILRLKKDREDTKKERGMWMVELIGGVANPKELWPAEGDRSVDHIPVDWIPREGETESSEGEWGGSTSMEGDISWSGSEDEDDTERPELPGWAHGGWMSTEQDGGIEGWGSSFVHNGDKDDILDAGKAPRSSGSSTTGWDGDESDDTT